MNISIIGASGGVGREIVVQLLRDRVLENSETLQLISVDPHSAHPHLLQGFRADLLDAYSEIAPQLEVVDDVAHISGDIVVMTAGHTFATAPDTVMHASRDELAVANLPIFERFAAALGAQGRAVPPVVIVVTNPVELGVSVFCRHLPRDYVLGMGAHSDSLRFRAEIAQDLGIRRQRVQGYVIGEHGSGMVPLWSSVRVSGFSADDWQAALREKIKPLPVAEFPSAVARELTALVALLHNDPHDGAVRAYEHIATLPPDLRVVLKPFITHYTEAKTIVATAHATVDLVEWIVQGHSVEIAAQVQHEGENGLHGPCGARLVLAGKVEQILSLATYSDDEIALLRASNATVQAKIAQWQPNEKTQ